MTAASMTCNIDDIDCKNRIAGLLAAGQLRRRYAVYDNFFCLLVVCQASYIAIADIDRVQMPAIGAEVGTAIS